MKIVLAILLTVIAALSVLLAFQMSLNGRHEREIEQLRQGLAAKSDRDSFELEAACATQANLAFERMVPRPSREDRYESHYNAVQRTCFVYFMAWTVNEETLTTMVRHVLADAVESRGYATYQGSYVPPQPPRGVCWVGPAPMKRCDSFDEFKAFVKGYMP